jgi:hypothetical protein
LRLALTPSYGFAQNSTGHKMSDEELIKLSLSAAPEAVARDATVVAMDHDGKMRTLREGTGQWTCMPGHADPANPDPMCGEEQRRATKLKQFSPDLNLRDSQTVSDDGDSVH